MLSLSSNLLFLPDFKYKKSNNTEVFDSSQSLYFYYDSNNLERDEKHNLAFDLDFTHQFTKGELLLNTHFTDYDYKQNQDVTSNYFEDDDTFTQTTAFITLNSQHTKIFAAKADYNLPFIDQSNFETGLKSSHIETNSATTRYDIVNGQEVMDPNNTDDFDYEENIQAAYVNYSKDWEKWSVNLGLRTEQTKIKSMSVINNLTNNQDYFEWFPTASITYKPTTKLSVYTNYNRSIERPDYQNLNPFRFYYNDNNAFVGNPYLKPEIFDQFVFGTSFLDHFVVEAYYKNSKDNIYVLPIQDYATKVLFYTPLNYDKTIEYGFDFSVNFYATKDWSVYLLTSFYNIEVDNVFMNAPVSQTQWSNISILQNDFTFLEDRSLNANFTLLYSSKNLQGLRLVDERWVSTLSISKSIMNKKAIISLSAEDLFNSQDYSYTTQFLNQSSSIYTNVDMRVIKFGFRYIFGNTNLKTNSQTKKLNERDRLESNN
jgi:outer membrane receptor protein involved in Fe transport